MGVFSDREPRPDEHVAAIAAALLLRPVIEVAIVRPGPIQGNMVHPYLRRATRGTGDYPNDAVRGVLEKTLGVPLFRSRRCGWAVVAAGFTPGEADQLRRAMGAWPPAGRDRPVPPKADRGNAGQRIFSGIRRGGVRADSRLRRLRFPESHAASFALLVYVSAWLKCHYQRLLRPRC